MGRLLLLALGARHHANRHVRVQTLSRIETIGNATLYLGDCREILPSLSPVDAVLTDPPYGIGIAANPVRQKHEKMAWDNATPSDCLLDMVRAAAPVQIIWGGNYFNLPPSQHFLIWDKVQPENFSLAMCEQAWTNMSKPAKMFKRHVVSFEKNHPTQKPTELMEWCLAQLPENSATILDPFMGSGTTGVACANVGKFFVGIELEHKYFDLSCRRIEQAYKQPRLFSDEPVKPSKQETFI